VAGVKQRMAVDLGGLMFPLPVLAASGCLGTGRETGLVDLHKLGGVVSRSLTLGGAKGAPTPRMAETPSGLLSWVGLQNPGVEAFVAQDLPRLAKADVPVVASVAGTSLEEYVRVASFLQGTPGIVALEIYLGAPDEERGRGEPFHARSDRVTEVVGAVSRLSRLPVFVKLPMFVPDLVHMARACVRVGAHGLTLIDGIPGLAIDAERLRPRLAAPVGIVSGPAIKPMALAAVYQVAQALPDTPIMGVGGIATGEDAVEFLLAGAWAVQVGTAMLVQPSAPLEIAQGVLAYLKAKGMSTPGELRGRLRVRGRGVPREGVL
jgi:dihydroorotate dehydrogenase (NAD+) catalytic subunit